MHPIRTAVLVAATLSLCGFDSCSGPYPMTNRATGEKITCGDDGCIGMCAVVGFAGNDPKRERKVRKGQVYVRLEFQPVPEQLSGQQAQESEEFTQSLRKMCLSLAVTAKP